MSIAFMVRLNELSARIAELERMVALLNAVPTNLVRVEATEAAERTAAFDAVMKRGPGRPRKEHA